MLEVLFPYRRGNWVGFEGRPSEYLSNRVGWIDGADYAHAAPAFAGQNVDFENTAHQFRPRIIPRMTRLGLATIFGIGVLHPFSYFSCGATHGIGFPGITGHNMSSPAGAGGENPVIPHKIKPRRRH